MRKVLFGLAMLAIAAVPAAAQPVGVHINGELIGSYGIDTYQAEEFQLMSWLDFEYSNISLTADVLPNLSVTYRIGFDNHLFDGDVYTREAYASLYNLAPAIDEIKVGQFHFPFAAGQWLGFLRGSITHIGNFAPGIEVSGSFNPVDYRLAITNNEDISGWYWTFSNESDMPLWAKVSAPVGPVNAGLSYVKQGEAGALGFDMAADLGPVSLRGEYISLTNLWSYYDRSLIFVGADIPVTSALGLFGEYYNTSGETWSASALGFGVNYAISPNASLRVKHLNDPEGIWSWTSTGTEAQVRVEF